MLSKLSLTQPELSQILHTSIKNNTFSNSSLFAGPPYSSKMTAAIEVAKALSCFTDKKGENCPCKSCSAFDNFTMQNVIVISNRDNENRIDAAIDSYVKNRNPFTKEFLIYTVRLYLLSYHNGVYTDKNKKLFHAAYEASELLNEFSKNKKELKINESKRLTKSLKQSLKPLIKVSNKNQTALSVDGVRSMQTWLSNTLVNEKARIVIIEGIEKCNDSVRNSLLKILEEPNSNVYFILLSKNPSQIMKTILSRVRRYNFYPLSEEKQLFLLKPFNIEDRKINTLEKFFLTASGFKVDQVDKALDYLINAAIKKIQLSSEQLSSVLKVLDSTNKDEFILNELINKLNEQYKTEQIDNLTCKKIINEVSLLYNNQRIFNLPKKNMYENVYRKMMESVNA